MFFNAVREGDLVMFACDDEQDRMLWVQAIYRATGQSYKPVPPLQNRTTNCRGGLQKPASPISRFWFEDFVLSKMVEKSCAFVDFLFNTSTGSPAYNHICCGASRIR